MGKNQRTTGRLATWEDRIDHGAQTAIVTAVIVTANVWAAEVWGRPALAVGCFLTGAYVIKRTSRLMASVPLRGIKKVAAASLLTGATLVLAGWMSARVVYPVAAMGQQAYEAVQKQWYVKRRIQQSQAPAQVPVDTIEKDGGLPRL